MLSIFQENVKKSPLTYVLNYRIQQSLVMLQQAEANVTDVAYQVGFNSTSYFINQFRKEMKMTPLMYRKRSCTSHHITKTAGQSPRRFYELFTR